MGNDPNRHAVSAAVAKWIADAKIILKDEGQPESYTAPLLSAFGQKLQELASDVFHERDKLLSEGSELVSEWPEKIANLRMEHFPK
jgi:hypothetical protein